MSEEKSYYEKNKKRILEKQKQKNRDLKSKEAVRINKYILENKDEYRELAKNKRRSKEPKPKKRPAEKVAKKIQTGHYEPDKEKIIELHGQGDSIGVIVSKLGYGSRSSLSVYIKDCLKLDVKPPGRPKSITGVSIAEFKKAIGLYGNISVRFDLALLDLYSISLFKMPYFKKEDEVNKRIKALSDKYKTYKAKEVSLLIMSELLPSKERKKYLQMQKRYFSTPEALKIIG